MIGRKRDHEGLRAHPFDDDGRIVQRRADEADVEAPVLERVDLVLRRHLAEDDANVRRALAKGPKERKRLAEKTGLDEKRILSWANTADRMRIKGIGADYAGLLQAAGVDTVKELKYRNPAKLARAMADANSKRKLARVLPSDRAVERWIEQAKRLQLKITY